MRKIYLLIVMLFAMSATFAQTEDFESCTQDGEGNYLLPEGWIAFAENVTKGTITSGGWQITSEYTPSAEGLNVKMWVYNTESDCWLVTPRFSPDASADNELLFQACTSTGDFGSKIEVYVSTQENQPVASTEFVATPVLEVEEGAVGEGADSHADVIVDLTAYTGQNIYVGIKIHNFGDPADANAGGDNWWLDNFSGLGALVSSVSDVTAANINIYPNPTNRVLYISNARDSKVIFYNILGKEVARYEDSSDLKVINMARFNEGTYIVKVVSDNGTFARKIAYVR